MIQPTQRGGDTQNTMKSLLKLLYLSIFMLSLSCKADTAAEPKEEPKTNEVKSKPSGNKESAGLSGPNIIIKIIPRGFAEFFLENTNTTRAVTSTAGCVFDGSIGAISGGNLFFGFYQKYLYYKTTYPNAKFYMCYSQMGVTVNGLPSYTDNRLRWTQNNLNDRNQGFALQRIENGIWVNIITSADDLKPIIEYMNNPLLPNGGPIYADWVKSMFVSFTPNILNWNI